jgi:hypothetical protein
MKRMRRAGVLPDIDERAAATGLQQIRIDLINLRTLLYLSSNNREVLVAAMISTYLQRTVLLFEWSSAWSQTFHVRQHVDHLVSTHASRVVVNLGSTASLPLPLPLLSRY